ncbi:MAG: glycosyltransferase family protein [Candidatus Bathyarchaeia archaeon]
MSVYFGVCGIGLGHAGRCIPIAEKLKEKGIDVVFSSYGNGLNYIKEKQFNCKKAPSIGFAVKTDGGVDFRQSTVNPGPFIASIKVLRQIAFELMAIGNFQPKVVISDSRVSTIVASKVLKIPCITILNQFKIIIPRRRRFLRLCRLMDAAALALIGRIWTISDYVLIPDYPMPYTVSLGNLEIPPVYSKKVFLVGPIVPVKPEELPSQRELKEKLGHDPDKPLVFAPISGSLKERRYLIELLTSIFMELDEYNIVMSKANPTGTQAPFKLGSLTVYEWLNNRFEYLKACDVVVSRAGHGTITQSMFYGKPMILIPTPNHTEQIGNASRIEEMGLGLTLEQEKLTKDSLQNAIERIINGGFMERSLEASRELKQYDGCRKIVSIIEDFL